MTLYAKDVLTGRAYTATSGSVNQGYSDTNMVPFVLYNPLGSNVDCVIWKVSLCVASSGSSLVAGSLMLAANTDTSNPDGGWGVQPWGTSPWGGGRFPSTGVQVAANPCFLGNPRGVGARAQAFAATGTTGVTAGTLTNVRPLWILNLLPSTPSNPWQGWHPTAEDIDLGGELILAPGTILAFMFVPNPGAQTAQVQFGVTWSERPIESRRRPIAGSRNTIVMEQSA